VVRKVDRRRKTRAAAVVSAALLVTMMTSTGADAAVNNPGRVQPGTAYCDADDILLTFPVMEPAPVQRNHPGFVHGSEAQIPAQNAAFRANLVYWNGSQWVGYREGTWFWQRATLAGSFITGYTPWYDLNGNPPSSTLGFWDVPNSGDYDHPYYYAVWYEYYWWNDYYRDSGSTWSWAASHDENRGQPMGTGVIVQDPEQWCKYPGPNWLLDVN
jgi:hypothetical protein